MSQRDSAPSFFGSFATVKTRANLLLAIAAAVPLCTSSQAQQPQQQAIEVRSPGLVPFRVVGNAIPEPLTNQPGDPVKGKRVVTDASNSTCLVCHTMPIPELPDHGNLAPDLAGIGSRASAGELRLRIVNPKIINPDTIMPAYYRTEGLTRVQQQYVNKPMYSAQDVEDAIAFLLTFK